MEVLTVSKGQIIQYKGAIGSKVYHVKDGLLRSYTIDKKGKEHIFMFAPEGWIIADSQSPKVPSDLFIDAIEDSKIFSFEKTIDKEVNNVEGLINRISVLQERVIMLMSSTAIERYEHFEKTYPDIIQRVPQKMIASYLGITPEALSKVKSNRASKT